MECSRSRSRSTRSGAPASVKSRSAAPTRRRVASATDCRSRIDDEGPRPSGPGPSRSDRVGRPSIDLVLVGPLAVVAAELPAQPEVDLELLEVGHEVPVELDRVAD